MKKSAWLSLILILSLGLSGAVSAADGKVYRWKLAETWGPNFPIFGEATKNMAKMVEEMSGGRLLIRIDSCLLYKSDAADEDDSVYLGGSRISPNKTTRCCNSLSINR